MNPDSFTTFKKNAAITSTYLSRGFDKVAGWVTQLSWWKFLLFAALMLAAAGILQETLFSSDEIVIEKVSKHNGNTSKSAKAGRGKTDIRIDDTGVHINTGTYTYDGDDAASTPVMPAPPAPPAAPDAPAAPAAPDAPPSPPAAPAHNNNNAASLSLSLPPDATQDVNQAINDAIAAIHESAAERPNSRLPATRRNLLNGS